MLVTVTISGSNWLFWFLLKLGIPLSRWWNNIKKKVLIITAHPNLSFLIDFTDDLVFQILICILWCNSILSTFTCDFSYEVHYRQDTWIYLLALITWCWYSYDDYHTLIIHLLSHSAHLEIQLNWILANLSLQDGPWSGMIIMPLTHTTLPNTLEII